MLQQIERNATDLPAIMSDQQASAGSSMSDEQVINKHSDHQHAPATNQQAPDDTITRQIVCPTSSLRAALKTLLTEYSRPTVLPLRTASGMKFS